MNTINEKIIQWTQCRGCGARVADFNGPRHETMGTSPGCWEVFGEVMAREYENPAYFAVHHLTVDAYALQHPGQPTPKEIRAVALRLISLRQLLEQGYSIDQVIASKRYAVQLPGDQFTWLEPPASSGDMTILDVQAATNAVEHCEIVRRWAKSVWDAWSAHHDTIRQWATR